MLTQENYHSVWVYYSCKNLAMVSGFAVIQLYKYIGGVCGVKVIIVMSGLSDKSLNPGWDFTFHIAQILLGKVWIQLFFLQLWVNSRTDQAL